MYIFIWLYIEISKKSSKKTKKTKQNKGYISKITYSSVLFFVLFQIRIKESLSPSSESIIYNFYFIPRYDNPDF